MIYHKNDDVLGLVPILLSGRKLACPEGFLYHVLEVPGDGTLIVSRSECGGRLDIAQVPIDAVEPAYILKNGISYPRHMLPACIDALEECRRQRWLVHLHHGYQSERGRYAPKDREPKAVGLDWLEEWDCRGYVGNSLGPTKIPLLVPRQCDGGDGLGGGGIGKSIVRIRRLKPNGSTDSIVWSHPQYRVPPVSLRTIDESHDGARYRVAAIVNGDMDAKFEDWAECRAWCDKLDLAPRIET